MTPVARFEIILLLLAMIVVLEVLARKLQLPRAAALIVGGIGLAMIPESPNIELDPELVLILFLPPLLMSSAWFTAWRDFRADIRIIMQLAVGAVAFTTLVVGVVTHLVQPALPWGACFALGAIVSPPDAVAAKAVLQKLPLPQRIIALLEGESLVNDASGLVLFRLAVGATLTGAFSTTYAVFQFSWLALGGVVFGVAAAYASIFVIKRIADADLTVVWGFLTAWISYIAAEKLGVSGVLSTVACGMVMGWHQHELLSALTRTRSTAVWGVAVFLLESLIFILIGLSLRGILTRLGGLESVLRLLPAMMAIVAAVIVARFVWIFPTTYIPRALFSALRARDPYPPLSVPFIMSWAGIRGVVSLAAALSLPEAFPGRDLILAVTFAVILVTVLLQGATLAPLVRLLSGVGLKSLTASKLSEAEARARIAAAQLAAVEKESLNSDGSHRHPRLMEQYSYRVRASVRFSEETEALTSHRADHFAAVLAAVSAGRKELLRMHREDLIHDSVLHAIEQELDLEEITVKRFV
ncbi:Na+/H+ antiporter [Bradyrhizobium yuanmingense]|uniref:Na+/H+ antiporter n=1 Tax=Bradyrhizobium yuanmingense TaxID=108015 RepID=UPI0023B968F9|nr:Na+/H+ antiporter [Bradyrhizobium yuanmingense]MDF0518593.1 Na+/H+ antiporter [Bradyrhizobium yuanmingense]MDF0579730.1 Na+/H+ antiporter [Bradyrhizobium yuanmingense]